MTQNENDPHNSTDGTIAVALSYAENPDALARVKSPNKSCNWRSLVV